MVIARRLVKAGQTSHTLSLPKDWIEKNKLSAGDTLYIDEKSDTELAVYATPPEHASSKKEVTILIDGKAIDTLQRELTSAYLNNCSSIRFIGKDIEGSLPTIKGILQDFIALEVAESGPKSILLKDFLDLREIHIEKSLHRMDMMVRTMLSECVDGSLPEAHRTTDSDVNKLYFLLRRQLKSALSDPFASEHIGMRHDIVLNYWYLVVNLENLADYLKDIHTLTLDGKNVAIEIIKAIKSDFERVMASFYKKDKVDADIVIRNRDALVDTCQGYLSKYKKIEVAGFVERCLAISTIITTIAKIVLDNE